MFCDFCECERERESERDRETERQRDRERQRERERLSVKDVQTAKLKELEDMQTEKLKELEPKLRSCQSEVAKLQRELEECKKETFEST